MLSRVVAGSLLAIWVSILLPFLSSAALSQKMKVISTDVGASLPAKAGQAELLNSSLEKYPELTICARFLTHYFSSVGFPSQALISYGPENLLGSFVARSCDQVYVGCTRIYKDLLMKRDIPWIRGKVNGFLGMG